MHTLAQLKNSELKGITRLKLTEDLKEFPREIFDLADTLEVLDLSNNQLSSLPSDLHRLTKLKILFASNNLFTQLPSGIAECKQLEMIGFKSNKISAIGENVLPLTTRWLILTDNKIPQLPVSIGNLEYLQKLMLAGNELTVLPDSISRCKNLELIRLSANQLKTFPDILFSLPKLAWLAFSGNPCSGQRGLHSYFQTVAREDLNLTEVLGEGASGVISKAHWLCNSHNLPEAIAIKVFKCEVTSDGYPADELDACLAAGKHDNLVQPLAKITQTHCSALIMTLIPNDYYNLGQPPSLESCTRDTFTQGQAFNIEQVTQIIEQMHDVVKHLNHKKVSHGDLYAHNVLINADTQILLGDFGAASKYGHLSPQQQQGVQRIEQRALQYFCEDMLSLCEPEGKTSSAYKTLAARLIHTE